MGKLYSEELGINLSGTKPSEIFKWFIASILFGARITETIAKHTYKAFIKYRLTTPQKILKAGWDFLVNPVMREGGYVRYDEKTSAKFLKICDKLLKEYNGNLNNLHDRAKDSKDLEQKIDGFYGIGPVTVNIFLRELRPYWKKAYPEPLPVVKELAKRRKINLNKYKRKSIAFCRIEAGLIRQRKLTNE
jgi:hypothetical protein